MKNLEGQVALITGSGRGLGEGIALEMGRKGMNIIVNDVIEQNANAVAELIRDMGGDAIVHCGDISNSEDVKTMVDRALDEFGKIDVLVNNAGISPKKDGGKVPVYEIEDEEWHRVFGVNLAGAFFCLREVSKAMMKARSGSIVNIASISAKTGNSGPAGAHYSASKAGMICLAKAAARELAPYHIRVNTVAPGVINTPMRKLSSAETNEDLMKQIPLGRFGEISEIVNVVIFLASDASSYITGETMDVNGGWLID